VADATRFNVGDILQIDQVADGTANGPVGWVWKLDSWWSMRSPYADFSGGGGLQGKFPDSPNGYRPISQRIEVLAKSGNTLTIYDPGTRRGSPLHIAFPAAMDPEVWRAAGAPPTSSATPASRASPSGAPPTQGMRRTWWP